MYTHTHPIHTPLKVLLGQCVGALLPGRHGELLPQCRHLAAETRDQQLRVELLIQNRVVLDERDALREATRRDRLLRRNKNTAR